LKIDLKMINENNFDDVSDMVDYLMLQGALEIVGVDQETGEFLYTFTEKLAEINPNIYNAMMDDYHTSIMKLWELGFLSMDVSEKNPLVKATDKVFDSEAISKLSNNDRIMLQDILKKMSE
jgi:hypothetical protein